ncbi:hypothetical protein [Shewanella gelidii]|uniref:DUF4386 family protein n=1 Tax=Shewanella gelidii TaxID=1642821 RepID=A0A917JJI4_9GAMM|nr:hypothetical protein [Shewanella gelidii]MCL1096396.1 hypothetical protein [Shewanella gelidii]GGI67166.1 hypothetical protein GCM10009332_00250 [Shewanella gelidii]
MNNLQKAAGISAIFEALIYIVAFVYFGAFWAYPSEGTALEKMAYLAENQLAFSMIYFLMYAVFGIFLAVLVIGLHEKLKPTNDPIVKVGSVFGVVWVVLVIASGMLANIGLSHAISLMDLSTEKAFDMWRMISVLVESLGGGNELVGGLWVLLVSIAALKAKEFSQGLNYLGLIVGVFGIATIYPEEVLTEIFGITQILWFVWLGLSMLRQSHASKPIQPTANVSTD